MNFYYDLILGLQYDNPGEFFMLDTERIPQDIKFDTEKWMKYLKEMRLQILETSSTPCCEIVGQITSYKFRG